MPAESLVPGYKLVETFGPDSEYETRPSVDSEGNEGDGEVEEEVEYITLEISGIADVDTNLLTSYRLIGLDTPAPFLQLSSSGTIFKGRHHKLLGTELLFTHAQGDSDPSARHISLLGTTEQRIVFTPVEIRNPASTSSTLRSTSKGKTSGKESSSNLKKGKKRASVGTCGIEEVTGGLSVGVSKPIGALDERDPTAESGPSAHGKAIDKERDKETQGDEDDDMYATEEGADDGTLEANVGGEEDVGEEGDDGNPDLPPRGKRKPSRKDKDKEQESGNRSIWGQTTTLTSTTSAILTIAQGQHQQGAPSTGSNIPMAIDPALEALQVLNNQSSPQPPGSGTNV